MRKEIRNELGREVTVHPDYLRDDQGSEFGLWNVAAACHGDPRGEVAWPLVVAEYIRTLLEDVDHGSLDGLTSEEVRSRAYVKLFPADILPSREGLSYLQETVPGLVDSLVVDFPGTVRWLRDSEVGRFGGKPSSVRQAWPICVLSPERLPRSRALGAQQEASRACRRCSSLAGVRRRLPSGCILLAVRPLSGDPSPGV